MSKPKVLQIGPLSERFNRELAEEYEVSALWQQAEPLAFLREQGEQFIYMVSSARFGCTAEQLALLPNLRAICSFESATTPTRWSCCGIAALSSAPRRTCSTTAWPTWPWG